MGKGSQMMKRLLIIEIEEEDWIELQKVVKETPPWEDRGDTGFCLTNDPEYTVDLFSPIVRVVREIEST